MFPPACDGVEALEEMVGAAHFSTWRHAAVLKLSVDGVVCCSCGLSRFRDELRLDLSNAGTAAVLERRARWRRLLAAASCLMFLLAVSVVIVVGTDSACDAAQLEVGALSSSSCRSNGSVCRVCAAVAWIAEGRMGYTVSSAGAFALFLAFVSLLGVCGGFSMCGYVRERVASITTPLVKRRGCCCCRSFCDMFGSASRTIISCCTISFLVTGVPTATGLLVIAIRLMAEPKAFLRVRCVNDALHVDRALLTWLRVPRRLSTCAVHTHSARVAVLRCRS